MEMGQAEFYSCRKKSVSTLCFNPYQVINFSCNLSLAIFPACLRPYIPFLISMYTQPFSSTFDVSLYWSIISCGILIKLRISGSELD